ncbi:MULTISPECIES: MBL fold metallo-hydrolase [Halorubrum]|jgi:glyoxylase-like metal-dependent hydrolase (beta-lactamase superfamily II)|uniref:MBL fold metallo-hydrolase n=1 Tax=Halorubrum ezzemoulense TaxID=337243 RepID=A0A256K7P6_HALEZ|nr:MULTISPECIES: MBL fold metallo-hydrolase [Halorubrum]MDB2238860.1 MBL fold metallo-hydrolase [Halorubrum ezzemoulense]MDB2249637.1 MBL fold metallo-hydrolase [Halorubrum ezzemoulense]MDB9234725.1 MBL fold metallo-hydrolase [Halorubrum ezzemoulense]MDB9280437.1 MBL fold metallo-hydrolase [Halorubrum ezzemoulense]MDB9283956.1 MBL fold metallo-hydrolase [Halorubrum ezzemoulense]
MEPITVTADAEEFTCNAYLVVGDETTLVDAGTMPGVEDAVADALADAGVDGLDRVVITHQHRDHVGELGAVVERFDAEVLAYADHPLRDAALGDGDEVVVGDESCEVVYTPGHADDHVSLVGAERLYSGDVVVYNDGAFDDGSFGRTDMAGQSRERLIESLREILDRLPDSTGAIFPGHGDVYRAVDGPDTLREVIERATERAERREPKYPDG